MRKSAFVNAPVVNELPLTLECELLRIIDGNKYLGKIVNVVADERILDANGEISLEKFHPITFDMAHSAYYALGEKVEDAFSAGKSIEIDGCKPYPAELSLCGIACTKKRTEDDKPESHVCRNPFFYFFVLFPSELAAKPSSALYFRSGFLFPGRFLRHGGKYPLFF